MNDKRLSDLNALSLIAAGLAFMLAMALHDGCPNCGGGFVPRPIRPAQRWKGDNFLGHYPASTMVRHRPVDVAAHDAFAASLRAVPPAER